MFLLSAVMHNLDPLFQNASHGGWPDMEERSHGCCTRVHQFHCANLQAVIRLRGVTAEDVRPNKWRGVEPEWIPWIF